MKKKPVTRMAALTFAIMLLLSSCRGDPAQTRAAEENGEARETAVRPAEGISLLLKGFESGETVFNAKKIDLPLGKDEVLYDIVTEEDGYRIVVGYKDEENYPLAFCGNGPVYKSEYRYLDKEYKEDVSRREESTKGTTRSLVRIGEDLYAYAGLIDTEYVPDDTNPTGFAEFYWGDIYSVFKNGQGFCQPMVRYWSYFGISQMTAEGDTLYMVADRDQGIAWEFYINERIVKARDDLGSVSAIPRGVMTAGGSPWLLLSVSEGYASDSWRGGVLVPLDPEMSEYDVKGTKLNVNPTGLCATDGTLGYFLCGSELWYTDGKGCGKLYDYANAGFSGEDAFRRILPLSDGRILTVAENVLMELTPVPKAEEILRKEIVVGVIGVPDDDLVMRAGSFNRSQSEYTVNVRRFPDQANLNLAILSGEVSLIAAKNILLLRNYADKGILKDLEETAPELYEEGVLYKSILDAARWRGKSYFIPRLFELSVFGIMWKEGVEPEDLDTPEEFFGYIEKEDPAARRKILKRYMFNTYGNLLDEWIDWDTNTCHFDDGSFVRVLEFCNGCSSTEDETGPYLDSNDKIMMLQISNPQATEDYSNNYDPKENRHVIPWPSTVHKGAMIRTPYLIGAAAGGKDEGGVKAFLLHMFTGDLREWDLHAIQGNFDIMNGREMKFSVNVTESERDINVQEEFFKMHEIVYYKKGESDRIALTRKLIDTADFYDYGNNEIYDVLWSEVNKYFSGEITAEKAAEYIQNRVSIYLAEQG